MFLAVSPYSLRLAPYDKGLALCLPAEADSHRRALPVLRSRANCVGGCALLFTFRRLEVREGPLLKSRPWRDGPQAI